jgi:hypothetical protein
MFLWAQLVLKALDECHSAKDMMDATTRLVKGLDEE